MRQHVWFGLMAMAALALAGCGKTTSSLQAQVGGGAPTGSDAAQVSTVLQNNPDYVNEDVWQSGQPTSYENSGGFAAIRPLNFWRTITSFDRTVNTEFGEPDSAGRPTLALVTVHAHALGSFNILAGSADSVDTSRTVVRKPLDDLWTRKLVLKRVAAPGDSGRGRWRLVGTSGVEVHTRGGSTHVASLRIQTDDLDTLITDPLELHRLRRVMLVSPGAQVRLTATTGNASDVVLFYGHDMRRRFVNNGDGTFTFVFTTGRFPGLRNFGVDALSHGTLFDDQAPYDSNTWVLPFVVEPQHAPVDAS